MLHAVVMYLSLSVLFSITQYDCIRKHAAAEPAKAAARRATGAPLQTDCANAILSKMNACVTEGCDRPRVRRYSRVYHIRFKFKNNHALTRGKELVMQIDESCLSMIRELSNAKAPSGFEDEAVAVARKYAAGSGRLFEDSLRNLCIYREKNCGKPMLMLDAHGDEVGMMIHSVKPNGTLRFVGLGSWTQGSLIGAKVLVRNAAGAWIPGVVAAKPPHFRNMAAEHESGDDSLSMRDLVIDVGACSDREARETFRIRIGEPAVCASEFTYERERDIMIGKGFDCRIGCAAMIETMRRIKDMDLAVDVAGSMSSQEELGERGCFVSVNRIKPKVAIVFEGCPADDTFTEPYATQTALKKGPMIRFMDVSVVANPRFQRYTLDLAESLGLPIQASVREGGGNNGACINTALDGVPVIIMGVPVRYIHSTYGITSYFDFEATVQMAVEVIRRMDAELIASF